jgi:hypothetical protein
MSTDLSAFKRPSYGDTKKVFLCARVKADVYFGALDCLKFGLARCRALFGPERETRYARPRSKAGALHMHTVVHQTSVG